MAAVDPVLVLNMTRLGDLIQTTPLTVGLKRLAPEVPVVIGVAKEFEGVARLMDGVDEVVPIDYQELARLAAVRGKSPVNMVADANRILAPILSKRFSRVVNLTHSVSSAWLMLMIDAGEKYGLQMLPSGRWTIRHPWLLFFNNYVRNRETSPFNLVDMYALGGGVPQNEFRTPLSVNVPPEAHEWAEAFLDRELPGSGPIVAVQAGASESHKVWHPSSFIRMCRVLSDSVAPRFVFIGGKAEAGMCEKVMAAVGAPVAVVAAGKTDLPQLCALLSRADLMITNDTGPMHVATAVGTRVLSIALGPVYYSNTGPYGPGHVVFQPLATCAPCAFDVKCTTPECKKMVTPDAVAEIAAKMIDGESLGPWTIPDGPAFADCEVYLSGWGDDGLIDYRPLLDRAPTDRWRLQRAYRRVWSDSLLEGRGDPPGATRSVPDRDDWIFPVLRVLEQAALAGRDAASAVLSRSRGRSAKDIDFFEARLREVRTASAAVRGQGIRSPEANALSQMFAFEEENLGDDLDLEGAARENVRVFGALLHRVRSLAYLLSGEHEAGQPPAGKGR